MPLLASHYKPPTIFRNPDLATIYAASLRKVSFPSEKRERLDLPDGDFLDIDHNFASVKTEKLVILMHGLAGNAQRPYMRGMAKIFTENNWDCLAMNFRSCSGEINRLYRSYNAGATEDLKAVLDKVLIEKSYKSIALVGFSLGGNLLLKYLGENKKLPVEIKAAAAVSTPCDLGTSLKEINKTRNFLYSKRFIKKLKKALYLRQEVFPQELHKKDIKSCNSLLAIDELYTSKAHGYKSASEYYEKCSCLQFLPNIEVPTLLLNAKNDSFLSPNSFPENEAENSKKLFLEIPKYGGHVGFIQKNKPYYHEERVFNFIIENLNTSL